MHMGLSYTCELCDAVFNRETGLKVHKEVKHSDTKYPCDQCDFQGSCRKYLNDHIRRAHGIKKYKCEFCEYGATIPSELVAHLRNQHSTEMSNFTLGKGEINLKDHVKKVQKNKLEKSYFDTLEEPENPTRQIIIKEEKNIHYQDKSEQKTDQLPEIKDEVKSNHKGEKTPELKAVNNFIEHSDFQNSLQHILAEKFPLLEPQEIDGREEFNGSATENHPDS